LVAGLWLIYRRRTLRMPAWEAVQIVFGLCVPPLLAYHLVGTRVANAMYGTLDLYTRTLLGYFVTDYWAERARPRCFRLPGRTAASEFISGCDSGRGIRALFRCC
jgi:hypothetical protein